MKPTEVEEALQLSQQMLQMWIQLKRFFIKANATEPLTKDDERQFLEIKSETAKFQRGLSEKLKDNFAYGAEQIQNLLRQTISVSHMRNLPVNDRRSLFKEWHIIYIQLTRLVGGLEFAQQTGHVPSKTKRGGGEATISGLKSGARGVTKKKSLGSTSIIAGVIVIGLALGAIYYFFIRSG